jgi:hypothetical protein
MRHKKVKLTAFLLLIFGLAELHAQTTLTTSGSNASGGGGSASYSVGQVVYSTFSGSNGSVSQGVQQPFEISVLTGMDDYKAISLVCSAFPNPTTDFLTLRIAGEPNAQYVARLYDIGGQLLVSKNIAGIESSIPMKMYAPSTYFLKIFSAKSESTLSSTEIKSFKIIKK